MPPLDRRAMTSRSAVDEIAALQNRVERLYLELQELEHEVGVLRRVQPIACPLPRRQLLPIRFLLRYHTGLRQRYQMRVIRNCGLFDPDWYLRTYEDVAQAGVDPLTHFVQMAASEHRDPGPYFSTSHYCHLYPDIAANGMNPLWHYLVAGLTEGRSIRPGMPHQGE